MGIGFLPFFWLCVPPGSAADYLFVSGRRPFAGSEAVELSRHDEIIFVQALDFLVCSETVAKPQPKL
ncbi:MAG TPA: hypothetical protein VGR45_12920, partial [Stellaceae bacterium]|nr:hypothetical protein [Stellaceae bacterium]